jgi:hypothetical protein
MVLPGVPRAKRIQFVKDVVCLLLKEGLDGVTAAEHAEIAALAEKLLSEIKPVPEKLEEPAEEVSEKSGGC